MIENKSFVLIGREKTRDVMEIDSRRQEGEETSRAEETHCGSGDEEGWKAKA